MIPAALIAAVMVFAGALPAQADSFRNATVGATDPARGCNSMFAESEVSALANLKVGFEYNSLNYVSQGDFELDGTITYNADAAALRDVLQKLYHTTPDCNWLASAINSNLSMEAEVNYLACQPPGVTATESLV
jgi:hypothetical protein